MELKDRLKEEMKKRKLKVPALAMELGIPKDRIYAWYRDNTNPKREDAEAIEKWINEETSTESPTATTEAVVPYRIGDKPSSIEECIFIIKTLTDTVKSQQETINFLTVKGGGNANGHAAFSA